jgi:uncharacterized membrane protein YbhN (UPF0104 family)
MSQTVELAVPGYAAPARYSVALKVGAKALVSGLVILFVFSRVSLRGVQDALATASGPYLTLAGAVFLLIPAVGGLRWYLTLRGIGERADLRRILGIFGAALMAGQVMPSVAGDALRVVLATRAGHSLRAAAQSVLLERAFMIMSVLGLMLITAPLLALRLHATGVLWLAAVIFTCGLSGFSLLLAADRAPAWILRLPPWKLLASTAPVACRLTFSVAGVALAGASLLGNLNFALAGFLLAKSLGLHVMASDMIALMPAVTLATTLPISLGGWGVREGILIVLLGRMGVPAAGALSLSLLFGACGMISGLPFLLAWAADRQQVRPAAGVRHATMLVARQGR